MAKVTQKEKSFRKELIEQMLTLSTAGFGLVAALAWNDAIQGFVKAYIKEFFSSDSGFSGVMASFIYAIIITIFAVFITYELSRLATRWGVKK